MKKKNFNKIINYRIFFQEIHSQIWQRIKRDILQANFTKQKLVHVIGQTAITWPFEVVPENRGKDHFK
jgi:hypothetical protein